MGLHHGQANFVTYGKPSLFLDFANKKSLTDRISGNNLITFTRSSTGTYVGADGLIKYAGADEPRFDHDSSTGESLGLLIEESRTNLITYSEDFSQSVWAKQNGFSITSNTAIAPDGTLTADTASRVNLNAEYLYQNLNTPAGTYTLSCWIKSVNASSSFSIASYSGADGYQPSSFTATNTWERFSHTVTVSNPVTGFYPCIPSVSGEQFYIWGAQVEAGSFPTSYIPTSASTVTRQPDTAQITGTNFSSWYNAVESTILCDYSHIMSSYNAGQASGNERLYRFRAVGGNDTRIDYVTYNSFHPYIAADGVAVASLGGFTGLYNNQLNKTAVVVKQNDFAVASDGSLKSTDNNGTWPPNNTITEVSIGSQSGGNALNGHIKKLIYYPTRLTNAQLQSLTS